MRQSEAAIVQKSLRILRNNPDVQVTREAPVLGRSADLAILRGRTVICIEFKLNDWRKGIKQASDYKVASDYAYICLPASKNITPMLMENAQKFGVGILTFSGEPDWPFLEVLKAKKSERVWKFAREELKKFFIK